MGRTPTGDPIPMLLAGDKIDLPTCRGDWEKTHISRR
jgi:hypothetical protein